MSILVRKLFQIVLVDGCVWIGILTAVIGDVASAFGCSVGLKDSITAIAFVALGTSVPGQYRGHKRPF